jgi:hypothetical protein
VALLSLATLATAWSGYQAARWSGVQSQRYAESSALRVRGEEQATVAGQTHIGDLLQVNGWLDAEASGNAHLAAIYRGRFRPELERLFTVWLAEHPFSNPAAAPGPTYLPQYRPQGTVASEELEARAGEHYKQGTEAKDNDDDHVLSTVFFAAVLFLAAVSLRVEWERLRIWLLAFGGVLFLGALVFIVTLPMAP